jgi:DNA-binding CsgD family transcriptional regulator
VGEEQQFSGEEYGRAVDQRSFEIVRRFRTRDFAAAVVRLKGRQVGTLGSIVPTGRSFEALGHVLISEKPAGVIVQSGLAGHLTASGIRLESSSRSGVARVTHMAAAERGDLLDGDVSATYWARAWGLPLRLARLAVMLMASLSPQVIAERSRLSLRSVRTYTEALFARARVHSRSELALAALRDGHAP